MIRNPFVTRGMIRSKNGFWGRTSEIRTLYSLLFDSEEEPQSAAIVGLRRMGKSSLLYRIFKKYDAPEMYYDQLERTTCVMVSLQSTATKEDFFCTLLEELQDQSDLLGDLLANSRVSQGHDPVNSFTQILRVMDKEEHLLVLLFDEFECAAGNPNFDKHFFDLLRSFAQRWRVAFVVATQSNLDELWDKSLISSPLSSPFFNFFQTLTLRGFDEGEVDKDLQQTSVEAGLPFEDQDIDLIKEIGGNSPFFLNVAAYHLFQTNLRKEKTSPKNYKDVRLQIVQDPTIMGNWKYYWQYLSEPRRHALAKVAQGQIGNRDKTLPSELKVDLDWMVRRGLIKYDEESGYALFSKAFCEFVSRAAREEQIQPGSTQELASDIQEIISQNEGAVLEFKSSLRWDLYQKKRNEALEHAVIKTIAAFLNTHGGTLFVGVSDNGQVFGLEKDYSTLGKKGRDGFELLLTELISQKIGKNFCHYVHPKFHQIQDKDICQVVVDPAREPAYVGTEAVFYIRTGNSTQPLNTRETHEYINSHWNGR